MDRDVVAIEAGVWGVPATLDVSERPDRDGAFYVLEARTLDGCRLEIGLTARRFMEDMGGMSPMERVLRASINSGVPLALVALRPEGGTRPADVRALAEAAERVFSGARDREIRNTQTAEEDAGGPEGAAATLDPSEAPEAAEEPSGPEAPAKLTAREWAEDIQRRRLALETTINNQIQRFEDDTGLTVQGVDLDRYTGRVHRPDLGQDFSVHSVGVRVEV